MSSNIANRDFVFTFISQYREHPCLWDVTDEDYHYKQKKAAAMEELLRFYKKRITNATITTISKKLKSLRASFRKEYNKVQESIKSGAGTDDVHVPKLWYYDHLLFLKDTETPREPSSVEKILEDPFEDTEQNDTCELTDMDVPVDSPIRPCSNLSTHLIGPPSNKRTKSQADTVLTKISNKLDQPRPPPMEPKKFTSFGEYVAEKLRSFPSNVAIHCEKIISDALYYAELRNLNVTSRIVTDPVKISIVPRSELNTLDDSAVTSRIVTDPVKFSFLPRSELNTLDDSASILANLSQDLNFD